MGGTFLILLVVIVLAIAWAVVAYNGLVVQRTRVHSGWSMIGIHLDRRYDLVPTLVEIAESHAGHERETLEDVRRARADAMAATGVGAQARAESQLSQALFSLRALAERHPDVWRNANFGRLQDELTNTEEKIASARRAYNDAVERYDSRRRAVPTNIIAGMGAFQPYERFEADPDSRTPVQVGF